MLSGKQHPLPTTEDANSTTHGAQIFQDPFDHSRDAFADRHIGPDSSDIRAMTDTLGLSDLDELIDAVVPGSIRLPRPLNLPPARSQAEALSDLRDIAEANQIFRSYLGMGFHASRMPPVIRRNVLENPGWYTQYTPYQAEIAQGRLEVLLAFQTLVCDLTGMEVANASLLDEATACGEALSMCAGQPKARGRRTFFVSELCHPQNIAVVRTRAEPLGINVVVGDHQDYQASDDTVGLLLQFPSTYGDVLDYRPAIESAHEAGALVVVAADLLSLTLLTPPGEFGADIAVGNAQRFGIPLAYGGPHAGFLATRDRFKRLMPGRVVGVSRDARGRPAYRLALQTREQHIRREKATSNICTAQALLANMAALYAMWHGPDGLRRIAESIHRMTHLLAVGLNRLGHTVVSQVSSTESGDPTFRPSPDLFVAATGNAFFDTLRVRLSRMDTGELTTVAARHRINLRVLDDNTVGVSLDETTGEADLNLLLRVFNGGEPAPFTVRDLSAGLPCPMPVAHPRTSPFLNHPIFHRYHSETEMMRYLKRLETKDLSLTTSMIPLGSCTMKLNSAGEMLPITWPEFADIHPYAPPSQAEGYHRLFADLDRWLAEITGFASVSLQPNAGSQGEFAGLMVIRQFHASRGESHRKACLIPTSAHGTNPASAVMAGMTVVPIQCDSEGNISLEDLQRQTEAHSQDLAALMVTYPSTHGVFEESIGAVCDIVNRHGWQLYMDGANMNAQVGLCRPAEMGADVCHLNLHKTFSIPHGGGGPGMGPICVAEHLARFLPGHPALPDDGDQGVGAIAAAPYGSPGILPISWMYIATMGPTGLTRASKVAILNANYIARRLKDYYPLLFAAPSGWVAHECILDLRPYKSVTVEDVAKRLMDYGFHAPTVSWPVAGTLMVEPTESESKAELDRFCDAMISIHKEIAAIEAGQIDSAQNPLKNAPHTADQVSTDEWSRPYSREVAAFPAPWQKDHKFWPASARIDNVYGDRNPVCTCSGWDATTEG